MVNPKNYYWLALSLQDAPILIKTKHQVHIMVFGVVSYDDDIMPWLIFPRGVRFKIEAYIKYLELDHSPGNRSMRYATQVGENLAVRKFLQ